MTECHQKGAATTPALWASWLALPRSAESYALAGATDVEAASGVLPPPGVEAILSVLADGTPDAAQMAQAIGIFAWERMAETHDLCCAMSEIDSLWDVLESTYRAPLSRCQAQHHLVEAWADAVAAERGSPGIDPLSGLHTAGYLYGRVHELDRLSGDDPSALVLLVVRWSAADGPWMRVARVLQVASALRSRVRPEATLSQAGTTLALALVPDDARSRLERIALAKTVESGELGTANAQVDVFAVPDERSQLPDLVTRLRGTASVDHAAGRPGFRHTGTTSLD